MTLNRHGSALLLVLSLRACHFAYGVIEFNGETYTQTFDSLGTTIQEWTNDVTLPGWYAFSSTTPGGTVLPHRADPTWGPILRCARSTGNSGEAGLRNLGIGDTDSNRALGSRSSVGTDIAFALVLRNNTTNSFRSFTVDYLGEQWQVNGPPSSRLALSYGIFQSFTNSDTNPNTIIPHTSARPEDFYAGYGLVGSNALDLLAFQDGGVVIALDGHDAANQKRISGTVDSICWGPGQFLVLRWFDDFPESGPEQLLAIDDVEFSTGLSGGIKFSKIERLTDGQISLVLCGQPGLTDRIDASTDLVEWATLFTLPNVSGTVQATDTNAPTFKQRFYRAVQQ